MMLLTATSLPLLVALAAVGLDSGEMLPENAAALVGAGVLSVMVFPGVAVALNRQRADPDPDEAPPARRLGDAYWTRTGSGGERCWPRRASPAPRGVGPGRAPAEANVARGVLAEGALGAGTARAAEHPADRRPMKRFLKPVRKVRWMNAHIIQPTSRHRCP